VRASALRACLRPPALKVSIIRYESEDNVLTVRAITNESTMTKSPHAHPPRPRHESVEHPSRWKTAVASTLLPPAAAWKWWHLRRWGFPRSAAEKALNGRMAMLGSSPAGTDSLSGGEAFTAGLAGIG